MWRWPLALCSAVVLLAPAPAAAAWVAGWTAAAFPATPVLTDRDVRDYGGATVRQEMTVDAAGARLRVRMTNALGTAPLAFEAATVEIDGRSLPLSFGGHAGAALPAGASLASNPVRAPVRRFQRIAVTVSYGPDARPAAHLLTVTVRYPDGHRRTGRGPALAACIEVDRRGTGRVLVALGDSVTEGARAAPQSFTGWPEMLAARLAALPRHRDWSVVNAGIHGNRLLRDGAGPNALARFDRDVLAVAGVTDVLLLEGINDIGWGNAKPASDGPVRAEDVIAAYRQIIARAHAAGLRVIGATLPPFRGSIYHTPAGEAVRQAVNQWVRGAGAFDAVVDFDRAMADPADPSRLDPAKDSGDHLHPSDAGYAAMAAAIDPATL
ncbi:SGNH/GDSL hydrolase family protein [Sphingomonas sp. H39-1-10]|uniref:SGNH/GDSL hydrolase family protein n=1 Tax=Sphingomonas TaxID=13687 RepID=UPI000881A547|nr:MULTISPECIES: SGNH/GDSL hydrolase family protein [Sphingomonas]MDF0487316.1 SGNH/GDSL hydrolase family protein [Sphingomonas pollutisoli]SDA15420.1 Lysophospholipase L1 [Sphingomonas sp. NFR15]